MVTTKQAVSWQNPDIPSKWDIIPIHNSDRGSFKRCREYWNWNSPSRQNLTIRADILGINLPMWFGTGIHYALESKYNPGLQRNAVEAFKTWFDIQWRGGVVTAEWLDLVYDLEPRLVDEAKLLYEVNGLEDILPDPDPNEFDELFTLGVEMMKFYEDYSAKHDDSETLVTEHNFSVPIWDYENDCILTAMDLREDSPNHGKILEVHARGRQDRITIKPDGKLGITDYKTAAVIDERLPEKLETDEQVTSYLWAAEIEAQYYDLPHKGQPIEEVTYMILRKAYPKPPTELKNGMFSISRTTESTTYDMLMEWISQNMPGVPLTIQQQAYVDYVKEVGDEQFIIRKASRRNRHQLKEAGYRLYLEAMDMLDPNVRIYPNLRNDHNCLNCQFRAPCLAKRDGSDWEQLIQDNFATARDR